MKLYHNHFVHISGCEWSRDETVFEENPEQSVVFEVKRVLFYHFHITIYSVVMCILSYVWICCQMQWSHLFICTFKKKRKKKGGGE